MRLGRLVVILALSCSTDPEETPPVDAASSDSSQDRCSSDSECDDGVFCNGIETCDPENAEADESGCIDGDEPCSNGCDEGTEVCTEDCADADGDGVLAAECGGSDCDDNDPRRFPGNIEVCDAAGRDEDCNDLTVGPDRDGDGSPSIDCCNTSGAESRCGLDCNDDLGGIGPLGEEICNERDDDCDGDVDEGVQLVFYRDLDSDDFGVETDTSMGCSAPPGYAVASGDCDDSRAGRNPGAPEVCDGVDNDCDEATDEGVALTFYLDADGDDFGLATETMQACSLPAGYSATPGDCDDTLAAVNPGAVDECGDGINNDCAGGADEGCTCTPGASRDCGSDTDTGNCMIGTQLCITVGSSSMWGDCTGAVAPQTEVCGGGDNDCDGTVDEGFTCAAGSVEMGATACGVLGGSRQCSSDCQWQTQDFVLPAERADTCNYCVDVASSAGWSETTSDRTLYFNEDDTRDVGADSYPQGILGCPEASACTTDDQACDARCWHLIGPGNNSAGMMWRPVEIGVGTVTVTYDVRVEATNSAAGPYDGFALVFIEGSSQLCINEGLVTNGGMGVPYECRGISMEYDIRGSRTPPTPPEAAQGTRARRLQQSASAPILWPSSQWGPIDEWGPDARSPEQHVFSGEAEVFPDDITTPSVDETQFVFEGNVVCDMVSGGAPSCGLTVTPGETFLIGFSAAAGPAEFHLLSESTIVTEGVCH